MPVRGDSRLTLPVRCGAVFTGSPRLSASIDGIVYSIQGSAELQAWTESVSELPIAPSLPQGFLRAMVQLATP